MCGPVLRDIAGHIVTQPLHSATPNQALEAIRMIMKMVRERNGEIPQGVRKQDLDQVYKRVKDSLSKPVRPPSRWHCSASSPFS